MSMSTCHPALVSDTLVITSDFGYKSAKYHCGHGASESRSLLICKEGEIKTLAFQPGSDEAQENVLGYLQLRKRLGIPFRLSRIVFYPGSDNALLPQFTELGYTVVVEELA